MGYREVGKIRDAFYGKEDHGILTVSLQIDFGGSVQGFGGLALQDERIGDDFVRDLCATFGVGRLVDLIGKPCAALRCFPWYNARIEAVEAVSGRRFALTTWRRKHWPETPSPLEAELESRRTELAHLRRRIMSVESSIGTLPGEYRELG